MKLSFSISIIICISLFACKSRPITIGTESSKSINIGKSIRIDSTQFGFGVCEPSICISPVNTNYIAAASILNWSYTSTDGGRNWTKTALSSSMGVYGDPVVRIDNDGIIYYSHLSNPDAAPYRSESFLDRIVVQRSIDNGASWNDGSHPAIRGKKDQDKQWMAIDPRNNHLFMTWTEFDKYGSDDPEDKSRILFSKSLDQGLTWTEPLPISQFEGDCIDDDMTTEGAVPAVGPNGELYVSWAFNEKIYFDKSFDGGQTWMKEDKVIAQQPGGWSFDIPGISRCNGMPITDVDISNGPNKGTIYVNWSDQKNGPDDTDVWLISSRDQGKTWTNPIRVNTDAAGKQQFFCWMDIDQSSGNISIVFYDRREYIDEQTDVYLAHSTDGGQSFTNHKINQESFKPNPNVFFGDYNDISTVNGQIRPIWTQNEGMELSVWTAIISEN